MKERKKKKKKGLKNEFRRIRDKNKIENLHFSENYELFDLV